MQQLPAVCSEISLRVRQGPSCPASLPLVSAQLTGETELASRGGGGSDLDPCNLFHIIVENTESRPACPVVVKDWVFYV